MERKFDMEEARLAFCRGSTKGHGRIRRRDEAVLEHFRKSLEAVFELGFRRGFEAARQAVLEYDYETKDAKGVKLLILALLDRQRNW